MIRRVNRFHLLGRHHIAIIQEIELNPAFLARHIQPQAARFKIGITQSKVPISSATAATKRSLEVGHNGSQTGASELSSEILQTYRDHNESE